MKKNMSKTDRIIRVVLSAVFAYLYFGGIIGGTLGVILVVLAGIFLLTAILGFCPLYVLFKTSTNKSK